MQWNIRLFKGSAHRRWIDSKTTNNSEKSTNNSEKSQCKMKKEKWTNNSDKSTNNSENGGITEKVQEQDQQRKHRSALRALKNYVLYSPLQ